jgi:uncharacterized integral membrane protein
LPEGDGREVEDVRRADEPDEGAEGRLPNFEYRREGMGGKGVVLLVAAVLLVTFVLQNLDDANVDFLFWDWDVAIAVTIVVAAVLGFVIGWLFAWMRRRAKARKALKD